MEDPPMPPKKIVEKPKVVLETAFKPGGIRSKQVIPTFSKYPEYMPSPPTETKRKPKDDDAPPAFKMTHNTKSTPHTSVACNVRNLKAQFPSVFRSMGSPGRH